MSHPPGVPAGVPCVWGCAMKMTFTKSQYEMPDGKYIAKFLGTTLRDATGQLDQRGNPLPPGMTWDFEILDGGQAGKKVDKLTGRSPTPKSACGKLLAAISDTVLKDGQEVDLAQFVGQQYRITVQDNRVSDNPPPARVYGSPPPAAAASSGPPPLPGTPPPPPPSAPQFWVVMKEGQEPERATAAQIKAVFDSTPGYDVAQVKVCPEGGSEWKPLADVIPESRGWIPF